MKLFQLYLTTVENLKRIYSSAVHQLQTRYIPGGFYFSVHILTLFCGLGWSSMKQTTPSYTQLGQDRRVKNQPGFWGFFKMEGMGKKVEPFTVKRLCLCSRSWVLGGRNQSGSWDLLIHPFGPGSSCHLQRAVLWTLFPQAKSYPHKQFHCSQQGCSCEPSVTQGLSFHCLLLKATLWSLTGPSSSSSHTDGLQPLTLLHSPWPQSILVPGAPTMGRCYPDAHSHSSSQRIRGGDQAFSLKSFPAAGHKQRPGSDEQFLMG